MTANPIAALRTASQTLRTDGATALVARLRLRQKETYEEWLEERDIIMVIAALRRLSERQLERIGMSHKTLALDVEDLVERAARDRQIARDVLELVDNNDGQMMAAE